MKTIPEFYYTKARVLTRSEGTYKLKPIIEFDGRLYFQNAGGASLVRIHQNFLTSHAKIAWSEIYTSEGVTWTDKGTFVALVGDYKDGIFEFKGNA